jgi:hypothetical protein
MVTLTLGCSEAAEANRLTGTNHLQHIMRHGANRETPNVEQVV